MRIRHYGFPANRGRKEKLARIRSALQRVSCEKTHRDESPECKKPEPALCPSCKLGQLSVSELLKATLATRLKKE
jgi:hypothetical protein